VPRLPFAPGTVKVAMAGGWTDASPTWANVLHCQKADASAWSQTDLNTLCTVLASTTGTANPFLAIAQNQHTDLVYRQVTATELSSTGLQAVQATTLEGTLTGTSSTPLPASMAVVSSWAIASRYRGGKPRTYWTGITRDQILDGKGPNITAGYQTSWVAATGIFLSRFNAIVVGSVLCVLGSLSYYWSGPAGNAPHTLRTPPLFSPFLSYKVHSRIDHQRRRDGKEIL
jgi:hypothetical protein